MDYAMPRAGDMHAPIGFHSHPVPATTNPLGVKGCGEAGCAGALTSVMNAILDALKDAGVRDFDMPATPHRVWQAIRKAKSGSERSEPELRPGSAAPRARSG
jgi:carbon-monoxide dehydrogenase large subunit